ncbi:WLM domain-containing protein [Biscogniauxia mediterranea]|nr:WLM domain-containing protein [Biscogniauxia mediterranea]
MPIGIQRLNAKRSQPNDRIVFIKPLKGPDEATAQDFLERIAAQCLPVMRQHHLTVMSLEEYEPNREFVGRNFNAGEVIQLVLKSPSTGRWLPFGYVQMVMMHELAHCKQMNHSKAFWAVRNQYADQMRELWSRSYTGEGLWGRGAALGTGKFEANTVRPDEILPEHLCGGTYRSRGRRKRKAKQQLSYQERKERRILKKFGANGVALGEDEAVKTELEKGKTVRGKPRVAGSKRGRELRAAAALARFGQQPQQQKKNEAEEEIKKEEQDDETASDSGGGSETASDSEDGDRKDNAALDINGQRLRDKKGHSLVKVCEDEDPDDGNAQNELRELSSAVFIKKEEGEDDPDPIPPPLPAKFKLKGEKERHDGGERRTNTITSTRTITTNNTNTRIETKATSKPRPPAAAAATTTDEKKTNDTNASARSSQGRPRAVAGECPLCSFRNEASAATCGVCAHVLQPEKVVGTWRCDSAACKGSVYLNAGDAGVCGLCGKRRKT